MFARIPTFQIPKIFNVGGARNVPPTPCLRPANAPANNAANVERTGKARRVFLDGLRLAGQGTGIARKTPATRVRLP
jgi:hypothetical protein